MPEGDTIYRAAAALRPPLLDHRIERASPVALRQIEGARVTHVQSFGKHLLIRFDSGHTLRTHLGRGGSWRVYPAADDRLPKSLREGAVLHTDAQLAVVLRAPTVELTRTGAERTSQLGPDLLDPASNVEQVVKRARSLPSAMPLGELLLDQRVAAGIGNIHRCELLWAARLDPWTPQSDVDDATLAELYTEAARGLRRGTQGRHRHAVHGRTGTPCPRCGTRIAVRNQSVGASVRLTYWCPKCQLRPRPSS